MVNKSKLLDFTILTLVISMVTLQPYFMHGAVNFYETGQYLPQINELFHGSIPYKDMFIMRGPLEIFMPALLMKLFGRHIGILNAYFYFGTVLTLIIYTIFALRVFSTRGFSYLFTLVLIARTFHKVTFAIWGGIRFGFGILALLFAVNFLKGKKLKWLFLAGVFSGIAFLTSFEIGAFSFISIFSLLCFLWYLERSIKDLITRIFVYILGNLAVVLPFITYLFFHNAFIYYVNSLKVVLFNMTKIFDPSLCFDTPVNFQEFLLALSPLNHNFKYTLPFFFYVLIGIYLFRGVIKNKLSLSEVSMVPVFIYGIFLYKGVFRDVEGPQYRMMLQPLLLIMFFYLEHMNTRFRLIKPARALLKKIFIGFFILTVPLYSIGFSLYKYNKKFFIFNEIKSVLLHKSHMDIPYSGPEPTKVKSSRAKGIIVPRLQVEEIDDVVSYLDSHAERREVVFTFPDLGTYNFLTDRPPLGRFHTAEFAFMSPEWHEELMQGLRSEKPRYVICAKDFSRLEQFRPTLGKYLDEIRKYLGRNYDVVRSYSSVDILKIK